MLLIAFSTFKLLIVRRIRFDFSVDRCTNAVNKPNAHGKECEENMIDDTSDDCTPLFYCPGKAGFYSPRQGKATFERLNAFRNVGRFVTPVILIIIFNRLLKKISSGESEQSAFFNFMTLIKNALARNYRFILWGTSQKN